MLTCFKGHSTASWVNFWSAVNAECMFDVWLILDKLSMASFQYGASGWVHLMECFQAWVVKVVKALVPTLRWELAAAREREREREREAFSIHVFSLWKAYCPWMKFYVYIVRWDSPNESIWTCMAAICPETSPPLQFAKQAWRSRTRHVAARQNYTILSVSHLQLAWQCQSDMPRFWGQAG